MRPKILLGLIIFLAFLLRIYRLGEIPPALYWDEASLGYNAYTISQTLRDEHQVFLPISNFAAFGDYKPPGYIYADALAVKLFGLSELTVRLPSALAGTLLVLVTYYLVKELLEIGNWKLEIALLASLFVAISPWSLQMSRAAFEANLATLFSTSGIYFFLRAVRQRSSIFYLLSSVLFVASMYTFNSHRVFVPLIILILTAIFYREILREWQKFLLFVVGSLLLIIPLIPHLSSREGKLRFNEVTWLNDTNLVEKSNQLITQNGNAWWAKIIYNRRFFYSREFIVHFLDHFRFDFLFLAGDINSRLSTRATGIMYISDLLFLLAGIYFLIRLKPKVALLLFGWLVVGLIPASLARETPHALRILPVLPVPQILLGLGLYKIFRSKVMAVVIFVVVFFMLNYLFDYYLDYPKVYSSSWQYGYKDLVSSVTAVESYYDYVSISGRLGRPYIFFLFYQKYPPTKFWQNRVAGRDEFGFWTVDSFGKYYFDTSPSILGKWLFVRTPSETPGNVKVGKTVRDPAGAVIFNIYDNL